MAIIFLSFKGGEYLTEDEFIGFLFLKVFIFPIEAAIGSDKVRFIGEGFRDVITAAEEENSIKFSEVS